MLSMMIDLRQNALQCSVLMAAHDSNFTYREGQGDLLVTECFKVSQTLQA